MDDERFDRLARVLGISARRRGVLVGLVAGALTGALGREEIAAKKKKKKKPNGEPITPTPQSGCAASLDSCGGPCVNFQTDANNCGGCGTVCGSGKSCCNWNCVDTLENEEHCGTCGNACDTGEVCVAGQCTNCTQGFVCNSPVPLCDSQYNCACTSVLEGGVVCGWEFCSDETCASTDYCVGKYGPFSVCQAPNTGCCGQKCILACPSVTDRRAGAGQVTSERLMGGKSNFVSTAKRGFRGLALSGPLSFAPTGHS